MNDKRVNLNVEQVVDLLSVLRAKPWVILDKGTTTLSLAALRRDRGAMLADSLECEYIDPRDAHQRHGSLSDYARAVIAFVGLV